jgi:hypothetical protein
MRPWLRWTAQDGFVLALIVLAGLTLSVVLRHL